MWSNPCWAPDVQAHRAGEEHISKKQLCDRAEASGLANAPIHGVHCQHSTDNAGFTFNVQSTTEHHAFYVCHWADPV